MENVPIEINREWRRVLMTGKRDPSAPLPALVVAERMSVRWEESFGEDVCHVYWILSGVPSMLQACATSELGSNAAQFAIKINLAPNYGDSWRIVHDGPGLKKFLVIYTKTARQNLIKLYTPNLGVLMQDGFWPFPANSIRGGTAPPQKPKKRPFFKSFLWPPYGRWRSHFLT